MEEERQIKINLERWISSFFYRAKWLLFSHIIGLFENGRIEGREI